VNKETLYESLLEKIRAWPKKSADKNSLLSRISRLLKNNVPQYDWVGFYLVDPRKKNELVLGPYAGNTTEHVRIPFGKGICGQAALGKQAFLVNDVSKETNYLACNINVQSEIVLPIFKNGKLAGELDIDSHTPSAFDRHDEEFLKAVCDLISPFM
jgi:L-methionine (R)-S-oxide reductase